MATVARRSASGWYAARVSESDEDVGGWQGLQRRISIVR